jgi:thiol-disulfide isomerase/thioredoxin
MIRLVVTCVGLLFFQPLLVAARGQTQTATAAVLDSMNAPGLSESDRATRLAAAIHVVMNHGTPDGLAAAERLALQLDSLSKVVNVQKVVGHQHLLSYYRAVDSDSQIFVHASRILSLAPTLSVTDRRQGGDAILAAYSSLAEVYGDWAQADRAVALLQRGISASADLPDAKAKLGPILARYAQVGKPGASIQAQHWFNSAPGTTRFTPGGAVTLIEFTAHWCGPCRKSYPAIARLQNTYGGRGMKSLFVTTTYGFFKKEKQLTPAQEASDDSAYYLTEHALPVRVAVYETPQAASGVPAVMPNETNYNVGGIPQIVLLDRAGVVRMIVDGWDPGSEVRLGAMINKLVAERAVRGDARSRR